jgi:hypothetical protein
MHYRLEDYFELAQSDSDGMDFLEWLQIAQSEHFADRVKQWRRQQLLERFIREEPKVALNRNEPSELSADAVPETNESPAQVPHLVTETLAEVYRRQKKFGLALQTYKELRLLNPEKSTLFARRIREIQKESE